jgi:hypothetical protein
VIVLDMEDVVDKTSVVTMMMVVAKEDMIASCNDEQGVLCKHKLPHYHTT